MAKLSSGTATFYNLDGDEIQKELVEITFSAESAEKGGYEHFMLKEIHEQPKVIKDTFHSYVTENGIDFSNTGLTDEEMKAFSSIYIVACGSAWHVGMAAQYVFEDIADIPVRVELASEFRYRKMPLDKNGLVVVVSQSYISEIESIPDKIEEIIEGDKERLQWFATKNANAHDVFFVGRGIDYAIGLEGSLKMKEISYIHSEAYAAGELKHGTISLIEDGTLVIGVATQNELYEKTVSNMVECKARGAYLMALTMSGHYAIEDTADFVIYIPNIDTHFAGSLSVIPLQLLGYYISVARGLDVDKPRNLAKSVTVE